LLKKSDLDRQIKIKLDLKSNFEQNLIFLWTHEMIQGVDYLKTNQIVHCNIKPE
jgi:serine/threonine protein kinase